MLVTLWYNSSAQFLIHMGYQLSGGISEVQETLCRNLQSEGSRKHLLPTTAASDQLISMKNYILGSTSLYRLRPPHSKIIDTDLRERTPLVRAGWKQGDIFHRNHLKYPGLFTAAFYSLWIFTIVSLRRITFSICCETSHHSASVFRRRRGDNIIIIIIISAMS